MILFVRRIATSTFAVAAALLALAPAAGAAGPPRPMTLATGWEFQLGRDASWQRVQVPHVFDGEANENLFRGTVARYRLRFQAPQTREGWGWDLRFESVRRRSDVFLNGKLLGRNTDPYTPFRVPATSLRPGAENVLTVRVDNRREPGWREGWWNWGGITRSVRLEPRGRVALRDVGLLSRVDCSGVCRASVVVDGWVENDSAKPQRPHVAVRLQAPDGDAATQKTVRLRTIRPGETARVHYEIPVPGTPRLWAPEQPNLYSATVQARVGDVVQDSEQERVGLRTVRVRDGQLWLNGRRLDLRGASIQEDMPGRGPALTDADVDRIVRDLKAVGANVTRAHYLLDERLLDRFDEQGILVWSQAPVYHRDVQLRTKAGMDYELRSVRRTVLEARRHPSVLTHSVANELSPQPDAPTARPTKEFLLRARDLTRDLDPTVPVSVDVLAWPGFDRQPTYATFDLLGVNSYFGWYKGDADHYTGNLRDLEPFLKSMREKYPRQALVVTEFGAEATMNGPADVKETYAFQADYLRRNLAIVGRNEFLSGAIYWTLREFAVKPEWDGGAERDDVERDGIHNKGLLHYGDGQPKPAWDVAAANFDSTPLYRTAAPRAVSASLSAEPVSEPASPASIALAGGVLAFLTLLGGLLLWALRDVWRLGDLPAPPAPARVEPRERRLRAVA